ncbi:MAG: type II secretion system protein [Thermoanaerobaculia bacterium]
MKTSRGFTLTELVVVCAVLSILAGVAFPTVKYTRKRMKEIELHAQLREMRAAVDEYKRYSDAGFLPVEFGTDGYPKDLDKLVDGVDVIGQIDKKARFLRRIGIDPMTGTDEWGLRSYQDEPDATSWGGEDVFDVYSLSNGVGLNGVPYSKW